METSLTSPLVVGRPSRSLNNQEIITAQRELQNRFLQAGARVYTSGNFEEIADDPVEPVCAVPLHPVGAAIEEVKLGVGNQLE